jgi:hypothetical protein
VQVDTIKPKLKAPGTKRLKLDYDGPLSNFGFKFNLRRYSLGATAVHGARVHDAEDEERFAAGAYTRPFLSST